MGVDLKCFSEFVEVAVLAPLYELGHAVHMYVCTVFTDVCTYVC